MKFIDEHEHRKHRTHRNILYALVVVLLVIQAGFIVVVYNQAATINLKLDKTRENITEHFTNVIEENDISYQQQFNEISSALLKQQSDFDKEIKQLQLNQADFSAVIEDSVKAVVTIATDKASASGFIIDSDGYIVTNQHVIADADRIRVVSYDKTIYEASLIGEDTSNDIALLKISGTHDYIELADSNELQVGKKVIAIGNPLGLSFTVTEGIISALHRKGLNNKEEYIQTDVSLNPGNSGSPLIDTSGKVVGINNFKLGGAESLGFALESNAVRTYVNALANTTIIE